ncbi:MULTISPECIES: fructosamine kinase family protein [unclassified Colwellia]|uniref:fructosamine kinase family protein n=1 Tax=unclassified Colwellia TaxID=196834 RepID=UPI0015F445BA|nr:MULTISPECIES: fructosamine kinase family protein [unclassified Colwellia]MBA6233559.1 fructosamine kinase family protein [Colwellia sp. MB02u-7]MBA6238119.1 fructosamine kinase family protein [Colwellia sp. MB02u-11]MBA6257348.1 fructosamine kinase family protein [Colwellia sp. MB3u-28]MBA6258932.1 fructosamine kinase family protein [Colwellia sp. MB3u-41]MBA6299744.1 fructosamine kinase family protein [Colwellia sp. MB3u-22]
MWQCIEQAITAKTGEKFTVKNKRLISTSESNLAFQLSDEHHNYFVKIKDKNHFNYFESEAYALNQIDSLKQVTCPKVITLGNTRNKSFIVLNYIPFAKATEKHWHHFGAKLAMMHKCSSHGKFGWQHDNYIGDTLQPNNWRSNWKTFFAEQRVAWQLQLLSEKSIKLGDIDHIANICHDRLNHHDVKPCLVHGDLWLGNLGFTDSASVIYDPACYYGDREVDIAMTELFGQLPYDFYQGYQDVFPLDKGYEQRKLIYNFYHILNHANLYGGIYIDQSRALLSRILSLH